MRVSPEGDAALRIVGSPTAKGRLLLQIESGPRVTLFPV
jgi:hypothetical protein